MSDGHASIGYGFEIPPEMTDESEADLEDLLDDESLGFMWFGDCYAKNFRTFLIIKESKIDVYTWADGAEAIDPIQFETKSNWNKKLTDWAEKHNVSKPQIGWWLCASI